MRILTDPGIVDKAVIALAESVASILGDQNGDKAVALTKTFEQCSDYLKANVVTDDDPSRTNTIPDDDKLSSRLKEMVRAMIVVDPSKTEEEHLFALLHSARGRRLAEHLSNLTKKDSPMTTRIEEMATMREFIKSGGMSAVAKRILETGGTSLNEHEYTTLVQEDASLKKISFEKAFADPTVQRAYKIIREARYVKELGWPNMMDTTPRSTETGSTAVEYDGEKALRQLNELAEKQRRLSPTLTIQQAFARVYENPENAKLVQAERRGNRPNVSSPSYAAEER